MGKAISPDSDAQSLTLWMASKTQQISIFASDLLHICITDVKELIDIQSENDKKLLKTFFLKPCAFMMLCLTLKCCCDYGNSEYCKFKEHKKSCTKSISILEESTQKSFATNI